MNVKRHEFSDAPVELIDRLAGNYFFSSTAFSRLWETMGGRPVYWTVEEGGKIIAVLPGVEFGRGRLRRFQSMPNGCYGRILFNPVEDNRKGEMAESITKCIRAEKYVKAYLTDFHKTIEKPRGFKIQENVIYLVDISSPDWEPPDGKLRQQIHKAEREGVRIEPFNLPRHINNFMKLVALHENRRRTKSRYTQAFFEALADLASGDARVQWVWCEHEGKPAASSIFFREGDSILHWQMYYDEAMSHVQATKLIPYEAAKAAQKKGIAKFNLGASPREAEGAETYKSKWGGEKYEYNGYVYKNFLGKLW